MTVQKTVRKLRKALGLTQEEFAKRLHVSVRTVSAYELYQPPKGAMLIELNQLALKHEKPDLADVFWDAAAAELGHNSPQRILEINNVCVNTLAAHRRGEAVDFPRILEVISAIVMEISPSAQWFRGDHLKPGAKQGTKKKP